MSTNVYVNSGIGAQLVMIPEATYGVAPAITGANVMYHEFESEGLELKKTAVQGKGLRAGGVHNRSQRRKVTNYDTTGPISMDLPTRYMNQLLMQMFGSKGNAAATLTQDGTTGAYSATHAPGSLKGVSMCIQKGVPSVDGSTPNPFTYVGQKLADWEVSVATGSIAKLAMSWTGRNELAGAFPNGGASASGDPLNAATPALATWAGIAANDVFHFREAVLLTGGTPSTTSGVTSISGATAAGNVKSASVKYGFKYDTTRNFLGSKGFIAEPIENDMRDITGQFEIEWLNSEAMYTAFAADTPTALQLVFTGDPIGSGSDHSMLSFLISDIFLEGETPKVGGPQVVTQKVPFTGLDDEVNNPIQATYWTLDTV